jgi:hypothetical protein
VHENSTDRAAFGTFCCFGFALSDAHTDMCAAETRATDMRDPETRATDMRATETRATETRDPETRGTDMRGTESRGAPSGDCSHPMSPA